MLAVLIKRLADKIKQESQWAMTFAGDIMLNGENREEVKAEVENWIYALEKRKRK